MITQQRPLAQKLKNVYKAIEQKSTLPIITYVKLSLEENTLELTGTDLEKTIIERLKVTSHNESFSCCVPSKLFVDLVNNSEGEIELTFAGFDTLLVRNNGTELKLKTMPVEEYPIFDGLVKDVEPVVIHSDELAYLIQNTVFAAATDIARPILTGVYFHFGDEMYVSSADGFRLVFCKYDLKQEMKPVVIPADFLAKTNELFKEADSEVKIYTNDSQMRFELQNTTMICQLLVGEFPDVKMLIPKSYNVETIVPVKELSKALKQLGMIVKSEQCLVGFHYTEEGLNLTARSSELGEAQHLLKTKVTGEYFTAYVDYRLVLESIAVMNGNVLVRQEAPTRFLQLVPESEQDNVIHIIAPMYNREDTKE